MVESYFYHRFFDEVDDRLDENYNNPKYDLIQTQLQTARYDATNELGKPKCLLKIVSGKTPKGIRYLDSGIPFLGSSQILFERVEINEAPKISKEIHETTLASSKIKKGNVLITMAGTIGRSAVYPSDEECNANQAVAILTINEEEIEPEFLTHYLNSQLGQLFFGKLQHISSQPNINLEEIKKIKLVLPSKNEQKEILERAKAIEKQSFSFKKSAESIKEEAELFLLDELKIKVSKEELKNYFFKSGEDASISFFVLSEDVSDRLN